MYYVFRIQRKKSGDEIRNVTAFNNTDDAEIQYHKCLAADMKNADLTAAICMIISEDGYVMLSKKWTAQNPEPVSE